MHAAHVREHLSGLLRLMAVQRHSSSADASAASFAGLLRSYLWIITS